jgi:hypothetical protein
MKRDDIDRYAELNGYDVITIDDLKEFIREEK